MSAELFLKKFRFLLSFSAGFSFFEGNFILQELAKPQKLFKNDTQNSGWISVGSENAYYAAARKPIFNGSRPISKKRWKRYEIHQLSQLFKKILFQSGSRIQAKNI